MADIDELENNQQEILQTLNNGLKSTVKENRENINKLIWIIIGGLGGVIMFLAGIAWQLSQIASFGGG